jgi:hypothetical protein
MKNNTMFSIPYGLPMEVALQAVQEKWPTAVLEVIEPRYFSMSIDGQALNNVNVNAVPVYLEGVAWYYQNFQRTIVKVVKELNRKQITRRTKP